MTRVAITGIGVIAPGGFGIDAFRGFLAAGETATRPVDRFDTTGLRAHNAAVVDGFQPRDFIAPMKLRRMNMLSRFSLAAAKLALADAAVHAATLAAGPAGIAFGTAFGPVQTSVDYLQEYVEKGAALAPPQLFAESVANAPGSHIAIELGFRGFNITITQRESSAVAAAMYACTQIVKGVPAAMIGGVEGASEMLFSVLDRLGALAHAEGETSECSRPFDRRRNGMVLGEGSAVLLAENATAAAARAKIYGWLSGFGIARDTSASTSDWGDGADAVAAAMQRAVDDAGIGLDAIDAIFASANSNRRADRLEWQAIEALFGEHIPPVVATKGLFGEYAAGGALPLVAALVAIKEQALPGSCGFEEGDEGMRIRVTRARTPSRLRHVLLNTVSAGGGIVCCVVSRDGNE
ncbi:MAG TPA: beta-ketoacyl synthase N-terminal-like domain-containing protein [Thermoanaerobaculia bacterium]|nr:beta-ketoacyl synthase N-terminal-like domain-containing protein [Thermoanaerobaculia bacterium]